MASNWYTEPMPPGWQAKWDAGQNRYFFIDHNTKKTSWVDPRSPQGRHQVAPSPRPQNTNYGQYGGSSTSYPMQPMAIFCSRCNQVKVTARGQVCSSCTAKISQPKCSKCHNFEVQRAGDTCTQCMLRRLLQVQETSFTDEVEELPEEPTRLFVRADPALTSKLKESFPEAFDSHIRAALESNDNDERKASLDLEKRGYKKVSQQEILAEKLMQQLKPLYPECGDDILRTTIISCDCVESPTKRKLKELGFLTNAERQAKEREENEAKKKREKVERKIRKDYVHVASDLITMALESTNYDEKKAIDILKSIESPTKPAAKPATKPAAKSLSATAGTGKENQPSTSSTSPAKPSGSKATPEKKKTTVPQPKAPASKSSQPRPTKAVKSQPTPKLVAVSKRAVGPDPTLPKGTQDSLLLKGYCDITGHNEQLVSGPSCRVMGSQGACGPDTALVHGPMRLQLVSV